MFDFKKLSVDLEDAGFDGILFPWTSLGDDYFIHIANNIDLEAKIKYMVAIRPYTVSPQYLVRTNRSMERISNKRILINFVTGWTDDYEKEEKIGGILESVNDFSLSIDKSNYIINYLDTLNQMKDVLPDFYISCTNNFVFKAAQNNKIIVPYSLYKAKKFDLNPKNTMIHVSPIIRDNEKEIENLDKKNLPQDAEFFTKNDFKNFIFELKNNRFDGVMLSDSLSDHEAENILSIMKEIKNEGVR